MKVYVNWQQDGLDEALRRFKRFVNKEGILTECKMRQYFMTKSERAKFKAKTKKK